MKSSSIFAVIATIAISIASIGYAIAQSTQPPYYIRQALTAISSTNLSFTGMQGQNVCSIVLNATGASPVTVNSANLTFPVGNGNPPINFYDAQGNSIGTTFTTAGQKAVWFPCSNATGVTFSLTVGLSYTYTFIATSSSWAFGNLANIPAPCATNQADGACNVHNTTSDFTKSLAQLPTSCAIANAVTTKNLCITGSTTQNRYVWMVEEIGNTTASVPLQVQVGQQSVTACDTNCVNWTPSFVIGTGAGAVTCLYGVPAPPGNFGTCGFQIVGIPLPASNPTTNLYITSGATAPSAGTVAWAYATTVGY